jgi:NTE family protein
MAVHMTTLHRCRTDLRTRMEKRPFVLSGGGARGIAHLGVLEAFAEQGITPSAISATSAGAMLGAFIADGRTPRETLTLLTTAFKGGLFSFSTLRSGLLTSRKLAAFLETNLRAPNIEALGMPFYISATDLERGGQRFFSEGELVPALMAASAIPVVFPPVKVHGTYYVDGGLSNNLPVEPFADHKHEVIAVYANPLPAFVEHRRSLLATMDRAWHLSFREMVVRSSLGCELFVEPAGLSRFALFDLRKAEEIFAVGYDHTRRLLQARS